MSALQNVGRWAVPTLCTYAALTTVNRGIMAVALDAKRSAQPGQQLAILGALALLYLLAGWGVYGWRRWAPYLAIVLFARFVYSAVSAGAVRPEASLEAALFVTACLWFLLPDVRLSFRHGKWLF